MSIEETRTSNVNETRTEVFYPEMMPDEWKDKYEGLRVGRSSDNPEEEILYGVYQEEGQERLDILSMDDFVREFEQVSGFTSRRWSESDLGKNPQLANALIENALLERKVRQLTTQNERNEEQIRGLSGEVAGLNDRISALENRPIVANPTTNRDVHNVDVVTTEQADARVGGRARLGREPAPDATDRAIPTDPAVVQARTATEVDEGVNRVENDETQERRGGRWNRLREHLGGAVLGWQVRAHNGAYRIIDRRGRQINVVDNEEVAHEYVESQRRTGTAVLVGGVALIGAGLIGWWLGKHYGHDINYDFKEIVGNNKIMTDQHNALTREINNLQAVLENQNDTINHINGQLDHDTDLINHLNRHLHNLSEASQVVGGNSRGSEGTGRSFYVERGSGIINEIHQYAGRHGRNISDSRAVEIYRQLRSHFGHNIINIDNTSQNTYTVGTDLRISRPGGAHWFSGAERMLSNLVKR